MDDYMVVPVFNYGGSFKRNAEGILCYMNGKVHRYPPMDLDYINFFDLETLFKELGYEEYKGMYWLDMTASDMETGLHLIKGDAEINQMRDNKWRDKETNEFYLYFDHPISVPEIVDDGVRVEVVLTDSSSSSSSSDDGYESAEDEVYKPPPPGFEDCYSSEDSEVKRNKLKKMKKKTSPKKKTTQGPKRVDKAGPIDENRVGPSGTNNKVESPKTETAKKKASKKYTGVRRRHILRDGLDKNKNNGAVGCGSKGKKIVDDRKDVEKPNNDQGGKELDSDYERPYEYESEAFNSPVSSDDEGRTAYDAFNEDIEYGEIEFKVGQTFITMEAFKNALKDYFVYEGKDVMYLKNDKQRVRAACANPNCPWLILTSWNSQGGCFQVKTLYGEHNCGRDFGSNLADRSWVTSKLVKRLITQPYLKPKQAMEYMIEDYNVQLSGKMISRALKAAKEEVIGSKQAQYGSIRDYLMELHRSNPGSTAQMEVKLQPESLPLFDRLYISLDACKKGFKAGCRPLIGLDGCFLKGYYGGQLLSAVGQDGNNHFYVIAYAVVPNECKETWKWFLTLLQEDLGECTQYGWNFISDQQKGLELALKEVMPNAHHRNCVLHIWKNFIKHFKDQQTKQLVWECARCTTHIEFNAAMEKLKKANVEAWEYMERFDPAVWSKAFFSHGPKVDNITNNMCEVWNAKIVASRGKPILTMCEELRCYLMRKMAAHKKKLDNHVGQLAPVQQRRLDDFIKPKSQRWRAIWAGDNERVLFEVHFRNHKVGVNLQQRTCTCNVWQLTGMPCRHAVAALAKMGLRPEDFVHNWLTMDAVRSTYSYCIQPVNSQEYWEPTVSEKTLPPPIKKPAHRPKMKRSTDPVESEMNANKARKTFLVTCSKCGQKGHYYKTCTNAPQDPNWQPMTKKERRAKSKQIVLSTQTSSEQVPQSTGNNSNASQGEVRVDDVSKAKKNKKKLPKTTPKGRGQVEIPLSQSAPQSEEAMTAKIPMRPMPAVREKQQIIRPTCISTPTEVPPFTSMSQTLSTQGFRPPRPKNTTANNTISAETIAAASSGTASRILKFIPTPGMRPPNQS